MNILSTLFTTLFLILGAFIWIVAMMILLVGSLGILRVVIRETFDKDIKDWWEKRNV